MYKKRKEKVMDKQKRIFYKLRIAVLLLIFLGGSVAVCQQKVQAQTTENITFTKISNTKTGTKIKWSAKKKYAGYIVYRSINNGKFAKVDTTISKQYVDTNIETGEQYRYKIKPYSYKNNKKNYDNISVASDVYTAKPYGVDNVSVVSFTDHKFITWDLNKFASGYDIYRKKGNGNWENIKTLTTNKDVYEDYDIVESAKYQYKVAAIETVDNVDYVSVYTKSANVGDLKGIDVSYHNGKIDWKKVRKAGISFAMIRIGYGTTKGGIVDSQLDYNYKNAKKNGVKVGLYFYSYADNVKEAKNEAKFTYKMLKKYGDLDYPVAFDFENPYRNKKKYKKSNTKIITTYCDYLEKKGYDTSVYSYMDFFKKAVDYKKVSKYGIWLARWTFNTKKFYDGNIPNVQMWQYSDKGKVSGISSRVDLDLNITH